MADRYVLVVVYQESKTRARNADTSTPNGYIPGGGRDSDPDFASPVLENDAVMGLTGAPRNRRSPPTR